MTAQTTTSFAELQQKAQAGDAQAQFDLALCYANGDGVEKDEVVAFERHKQAAELGHVDAQFALGLFYFIIPFKPETPDLSGYIDGFKSEAYIMVDAYNFLEMIIKYNLIKNKLQDDPIGIILDPAIRLAIKLAVSDRFERNQSTDELALIWLDKAAEQNHAGAIYWRGVCYSKGYCTERNDEIAFENFKTSAEAGYPDAYYSLALCYRDGIGCQQNYELTFDWIIKAVDYADIYFSYIMVSGSFPEFLAKSYLALGRLYAEGKGTEQNNGCALEFFTKATEKKVSEAQFHLGRCYEYGLGVEADFSLAIENYEAAFYGGFCDAETQYRIAKSLITSDSSANKNYQTGFINLIRACRNNSVDALMWLEETCVQLVFPYIRDRKDKEECYAFAVDFINKMIATYPMDYEANFALGVMSAFGIGIEKNKENAIKQFQKVWNSNEVDIPPELSGGNFHIIDSFAELLKEIYKSEDDIFRVMNDEGLAIAFTQQKFIQGNENKNIVVLPALSYALHIHFGEYAQARDFFKSLSDMKTEFEYSGAKNAFEMMGLIGVGEIEKKNRELVEKNRELEEIMAMFAHKFRSPLDAIIYNTEHDHQEKLYKQAAQSMRGLLDIFSLISTDADKLQDRLKQDRQGDGNLVSVLGKTLDMVLLHLLSASSKGIIRQHYLHYSKAQGLCDAKVSAKQWYDDFMELERQLQCQWEQSYAQLLGQSPSMESRLTWLEQRFFKLELLGFECNDMRFSEYGITESLLTILLNEFLVNAFKYYASAENVPVVFEWSTRDGYQVLSCRNPSTRQEREKIKGSGKGHIFLSALARKIGCEFTKPKPADDFMVEFALADELLISN